MAWREIKTSDVTAEMTPQEKAMLNNLQGATDNLPGILTKVIEKVRGHIRAGANQEDASSATSIPDQLLSEVVAIARWRWLGSFPALKVLKTEDRRKANDDAEALLNQIGSQDPKRPRVELPANPILTPDGTVTMPSTGHKKLHHFKSKREDGIV